MTSVRRKLNNTISVKFLFRLKENIVGCVCITGSELYSFEFCKNFRSGAVVDAVVEVDDLL